MYAVDELLEVVTQADASDLHLAPGRPPVLRIDGRLRFLEVPPLTGPDMDRVLAEMTTPDQQARFLQDQDIDFSFGLSGTDRFRVNAFRTGEGVCIALRRLPTIIPTLDSIGAPAVLRDLAMRRNGLILVTGPTGSGKTTTIAAMIAHIAAKSRKHILTIEDPVEYVHVSSSSIVNQREVGRDSRSFSSALRAALREDPDVIVVGEMRDLETVALALTAAETGHLVLATLHTSSAAKTVDRVIDVFPGEDKGLIRAQLATSLAAVISQTLIPKVGGGRIAAFEVMIGTHAIRNLIREGKVVQMDNIIQLSSRHGMQTMKDAVQELLRAGRIETRDADAVIGQLEQETGEGGERASQDRALGGARGHHAPGPAPGEGGDRFADDAPTTRRRGFF